MKIWHYYRKFHEIQFYKAILMNNDPIYAFLINFSLINAKILKSGIKEEIF